MKFIEVTGVHGQKVTVNLEHIIRIFKTAKNTVELMFSDGKDFGTSEDYDAFLVRVAALESKKNEEFALAIAKEMWMAVGVEVMKIHDLMWSEVRKSESE